MTTHVLVLHSSDEAYGSDRMCVEFVRNLVGRGCRVTVGLPDDSEPGWLSERLAATAPAVRVLRLRLAVARRKSLSPRGILRWTSDAIRAEVGLRRLVRDQNVDVLYVNSLALIAQVLDVRLTRLRILHCHEIATMAPLRFLQRNSGRLVDHVICVSEAVADSIPQGSVHICRNGITDEVGAGTRRAASDQLRVGFVGRLSKFKGIERFLEVTTLVERDDVSFEVTGGPVPGETRYLELLKASARSGVNYRGETDDPSAIFRELDVLVVPSSAPDPYPTVVLEGLRAGCVVLATTLGGASEAFDSDAGFVVDPSDTAIIAELIEALAADRPLVARMQAAARDTYLSRHRLDAFDARFQLVLDRCGLTKSEPTKL